MPTLEFMPDKADWDLNLVPIPAGYEPYEAQEIVVLKCRPSISSGGLDILRRMWYMGMVVLGKREVWIPEDE